AQAAGDVVFPAALPDAELPGGADPSVAGVEAQHHLAQRQGVVAAFLGRLDVQRHLASSRSVRDQGRREAASCTASPASRVTVSKSPASTAADGTIQEPPHASTAGSAR